jgi:hypothetical protein
MSVRFATVSFHTGVSIRNFFYPSLSNNSTYLVWEVISSMALKIRYYQNFVTYSMKMSEIIAIPRNK